MYQKEIADETIVSHVLRGDTAAFSILAQRHSHRLFRACIRVTRDYEAAQDCVQTTLATALEHLPQFRSEAPFTTWLTRIGVNTAIAHLRRRRIRPEVPIDEDGAGGPVVHLIDSRLDPEAACYRRELHALLRREIRALPPHFRSVLKLRVADGLTNEQAANALGITPEAAKSRLFRAQAAMRDRLAHAVPQKAAGYRSAAPLGKERSAGSPRAGHIFHRPASQ